LLRVTEEAVSDIRQEITAAPLSEHDKASRSAFVQPAHRRRVILQMEMHMPDDKSQGIVRTGRGEEQPADRERAQTETKTEPGHMPEQPFIKEKSAQEGK
jgi:hypothetical protein